MKHTKRYALAVAVLMGLPATAAFAGGKGYKRGPKSEACQARWEAKIAEYDLDQNGELDDAERAAMRKAKKERMLAEFDSNGDGQLDAQERLAAKQSKKAKLFDEADTNGDGVVDTTEANQTCWLGRKFTRIDSNGDGLLQRDEVMAAKWGRRSR